MRLPSSVSVGPWQTSPCQSAPGRSASPAETRLAALRLYLDSASEAALGEHAADGAFGHFVADAPVGAQRPEDQRHADARVLAADVAEELA